jgi:hypothetical protein
MKGVRAGGAEAQAKRTSPLQRHDDAAPGFLKSKRAQSAIKMGKEPNSFPIKIAKPGSHVF